MSFLYSGSLWSSLYCGVSSLCVGLYRWLVKVSWLGKLVSVFWWVELDFFSLECNEVSSNDTWHLLYHLSVGLWPLIAQETEVVHFVFLIHCYEKALILGTIGCPDLLLVALKVLILLFFHCI